MSTFVDIATIAEGEALAVATLAVTRELSATIMGAASISLMNAGHTTFVGGSGVYVDNFCFVDGGIASAFVSPAELRLRESFSYPALEDLRRRCLQAATESNRIGIQSRAVASFAHQTELRAMFTDLLKGYDLDKTVCDRRKFILVDKDTAITRGRNQQALAELSTLGVPGAYLELLNTHLESTSFRHRVAARCATVLLAAILLADQGS